MIRLANMPMPHVTRMAHSVLDGFSVNSHLTPHHRPIPEPDPEPNPGPDAAMVSRSSNIAPDDWDKLFQAIQARLEACVNDALNKSLELSLLKRHSVTKAAVLDCVESMKQLHASLTVERQAHQKHEYRC